MKLIKGCLIFCLLAIVLPAFAQEDEYAKFQGVWYSKQFDVTMYAIFIDNRYTFMTLYDDMRFCDQSITGTYTVSNDSIIFLSRRDFDGTKWIIPIEDDVQFPLYFSSDRLLMGSGDNAISFTKIE
jgi:hypothetical protein